MSPSQYLEQAKLAHEAMVKAGVMDCLRVDVSGNGGARVLLTWDVAEDRFHGRGDKSNGTNGETIVEYWDIEVDGVTFETNRRLSALEEAA